jgi:hypothetical protein
MVGGPDDAQAAARGSQRSDALVEQNRQPARRYRQRRRAQAGAGRLLERRRPTRRPAVPARRRLSRPTALADWLWRRRDPAGRRQIDGRFFADQPQSFLLTTSAGTRIFCGPAESCTTRRSRFSGSGESGSAGSNSPNCRPPMRRSRPNGSGFPLSSQCTIDPAIRHPHSSPQMLRRPIARYGLSALTSTTPGRRRCPSTAAMASS